MTIAPAATATTTMTVASISSSAKEYVTQVASAAVATTSVIWHFDGGEGYDSGSNSGIMSTTRSLQEESTEPDGPLSGNITDVEQPNYDINSFKYYPKAWSIVQFLTGILLGCTCLYACWFLYTICKIKETRMKAYNIYLIFLILPDAQLNLIWCVARIYESLNMGEYTNHPRLCLARNGSSYFYYFGNLWLNAIVGYEIYNMVLNSHRRKKTPPPTVKKVLIQIGSVFVVIGLVTAWSISDGITWSPYTTTNTLYCHTNVGSPVFTKWVATTILFLLVLPPIIYVTFVYYRIYKYNLLPKSGRTKAISMYFLRILIVFFAFYLPNSTLAIAYMNIIDDDPSESEKKLRQQFWLLWIFSACIPFQCIITIYLASTKDDIHRAVLEGRKSLGSTLYNMGVSKRISRRISGFNSTDEIVNLRKSRGFFGRISGMSGHLGGSESLPLGASQEGNSRLSGLNNSGRFSSKGGSGGDSGCGGSSFLPTTTHTKYSSGGYDNSQCEQDRCASTKSVENMFQVGEADDNAQQLQMQDDENEGHNYDSIPFISEWDQEDVYDDDDSGGGEDRGEVDPEESAPQSPALHGSTETEGDTQTHQEKTTVVSDEEVVATVKQMSFLGEMTETQL